MKKQVFYIHGGGSYSDHDVFLDELRARIPRDLPDLPKPKKWTETFRENLGEEYEVFMPSMPNSQNAKYEEWKIWFERHFEYLEGDITLVGWSLGGMFLVKYLIEEEFPLPIKALLLLAPPFEAVEGDGEDGGDFIFDTDDLSDLSEKVSKIVIFHSKDDFVVPYEHSLNYQAALPMAELVSFEDRNHFLIPEFPEIINKIKSF
jgi:predicted alpha/beta hydrolase family esterase